MQLKNYFQVRRGKYRSLFKAMKPSADPAIESGVLKVLKDFDKLDRVVSVVNFSKNSTN